MSKITSYNRLLSVIIRTATINSKVKNCLVTISDSEFSIASEVLLYSFHKYNPDFAGDVIVITDDFSPEYRHRLEQISPVRFEAPDPRLRAAVDVLQASEPQLQDIYRRLFSLEIFRLAGYDRVVYLDSDMYCSGDLSELFTRQEALLACPDGFAYGDRIRSFLSGDDEPDASQRYGKKFTSSFNAGVLSVGASLLNDETYLNLLELLNPTIWRGFGPSKFTDQMALNVYFDGCFTPLSARYNFMIFIEEYQKCLEQVSLLDARLVHFAGAIKPWNCYDPVQLITHAPQFIKFIDVWRELLDEVRSGPDEEVSKDKIARCFQRQQDWIREHNESGIEPKYRLY